MKSTVNAGSVQKDSQNSFWQARPLDVLFVNEPYALGRCVRLPTNNSNIFFLSGEQEPETKWTYFFVKKIDGGC